MTTIRQDQDFINSVIPSDILEIAIAWISTNMVPEDVFSDDDLAQWATDMGYVKGEVA